MEGWITLDRKILNWQWYDDLPTKTLFIHLLLTANHQPDQWRGVTIERGQLVTGRLALAEATGLSEQQIRTSLEKLRKTSEINITPTNKFSIITICKYDHYQSKKRRNNQQTTNKQPTANQQSTTNNNDNNDNNETSIGGAVAPISQQDVAERKIAFGKKLEPFVEQYGREMLNDFYGYWTEIGDGQKKMKFEKQTAFEISKRLATWKRKDDEFKNKVASGSRVSSRNGSPHQKGVFVQ